MHRSRIVKYFLETNNNRLITKRIPSFSPKLNSYEFELKKRLKSDLEKLRNIIRIFSLAQPPVNRK
jgi:transposase